jgi:hypothetical protein
MAFEPAPYPIPVWKRKHNVDPVVLKRGAVEQKQYTNAMGTAVTNELCKAVLMNENPKNLIDAIKRNNPQPMDNRKSVDDFFDDGRARPDYLLRRVHECFPEGAVPNAQMREALIAAMNEEGMNYANTLCVTCRDRLDPCRLFQKEDWAFPTETYELGGLGGLPFSGRMGLEAALRRVPDGGCLLIEYCSHTGFDYEGTLGRVVRYDKRAGLFAPPIRTMREPLECYEALVGNPDKKKFDDVEVEKLNEKTAIEIKDGADNGVNGDANGDATGDANGDATGDATGDASGDGNAPFNEAAAAAAAAVAKQRIVEEEGITTDSEFVGLFEMMKIRFGDVSSANTIHHYMATMLQKIARQMFLDVLDSTPLGKNVTCVFVGGIQLELPDPHEPYFSLRTFETRTSKGTMQDHRASVLYHLDRQKLGRGAQRGSRHGSPQGSPRSNTK